MKKTLRISFEGKSYDVEVEVLDNNQVAPVAAPAPAAPAGGTPVPSPMMGIVFKLKVKVGDKVAKNQEVAVLEAMKMENSIISPCDGTVASIAVKEQESVSEGQVLMTIA